ncbi:MAG: formimidoylglutamate deiminase [Acidobacteriota bacterium]|jgi:formimidoylglutamate deiminase
MSGAGTASRAQVVEAELTWTGDRFEPGVRVLVDGRGRIDAVEPFGNGERNPAGSADPVGARPVLRLPGRALLPGFVNAHSHAFQRGLRGRGETFPEGAGSFWSWREAMYDLVESLDPEAFRALSLRAFREMRAAGITTVGEFHYLHHVSAREADFLLDEALLEAAAEAGVRLALLQVYYAAGGPGRPVEGAQRRFRSPSLEAYWRRMDHLAQTLDPGLQSLGVVAHSLRAATPDEAAALHAEAVRRDLPFHLHIEEQRREIEQCLEAYGARPMELLLDRLEVSPRVTGVHCTHTAPEDMERFARAGGTVCICPTTEANLGDGIADLPGVRAAGGTVCLGTDSNARISMTEEMRWLELVQRLAGERRGVVRDPEGRSAAPLLAAATTAGARALGLEGRVGAIRPGAWADFVAFDLTGPDLAGWSEATLAESIVYGAGNRAVAATCVGGRWREERAGAPPITPSGG